MVETLSIVFYSMTVLVQIFTHQCGKERSDIYLPNKKIGRAPFKNSWHAWNQRLQTPTNFKDVKWHVTKCGCFYIFLVACDDPKSKLLNWKIECPHSENLPWTKHVTERGPYTLIYCIFLVKVERTLTDPDFFLFSILHVSLALSDLDII